jgi:hypothetical protein
MNLSLQSDGSLKRPVLALLSGQLRFDDRLLILDGGFVFIDHGTIMNAAAARFNPSERQAKVPARTG